MRKHGRVILSDDPALGDRAQEPDVTEKINALAEAEALRRCLDLFED